MVLLDNNFSILANAINDPATYTNYALDTGSVNSVTITLAGYNLVGYLDGQVYSVKLANTSTAVGATLNVNGFGAKNIYDSFGNLVAAGMLVQGQIVSFIYSSTLNGGLGGFNLYAPNAFALGGGSIAGNSYTPTVAVTFTGSVLVNALLSNVFDVATATSNFTFTISNPSGGQTINVFFTQDATGNRVITWPGNIKWVGGSAPVLSTGANSVDLLVATYRSSTSLWYGSLSRGFA